MSDYIMDITVEAQPGGSTRSDRNGSPCAACSTIAMVSPVDDKTNIGNPTGGGNSLSRMSSVSNG